MTTAGEGEWDEWRKGPQHTCTLRVKWRAGGMLLGNTGSPAWWSVMTQRGAGGSGGRGNTCVCVCVYTCVVMADSRFRTPETSTTLQSHFPPNKTQIKKEY